MAQMRIRNVIVPVRMTGRFVRKSSMIPAIERPIRLFSTISKIKPFLNSWLISFDFLLRKPSMSVSDNCLSSMLIFFFQAVFMESKSMDFILLQF